MSLSTTTAGEDELIRCPACDRPTDARTLANYGGVCSYCKKSFLAVHGHWLANPTRAREKGENPSHSAIHFEDGHMDGAAEFDFSSFDEAASDYENAPGDVRREAAELVGRLMVFIWSYGTPHSAMVNLCAFSYSIRPDLVKLDGPQIAAALKVTKQSISKACQRAEEFFGVALFQKRTRESREHMRSAMLRSHAARRALQAVERSHSQEQGEAVHP